MTLLPEYKVSYPRKILMALSGPRSLTMLSRTFPLVVGALAACSGIDGLPDVPRPDAVDAGGTLPLSDASEVADSAIPDASVADGGADAATPDDAGPDSTVVDAATDATIADAGPCVAESDMALCSQLGKNCGALSAVDHCGTTRTVSSCGVCSSYYESCGGGNLPNVCGCTSESDWSFCWRQGRSCGQASGTDNCGNSRSVAACGGACPADGGAGDATVPDGGTGGAGNGELSSTTASMTGDGLNNCGPSGNDVCARSLLVSGGTFYRGTDTAAPATISDFRLDKYEVTVGRFRAFVDAWVAGWRPATGSGKHTHLNGGQGLSTTSGGYEPGWDATWASYPGAGSNWVVAPTGTSPTTVAGWTTSLSCDSTYQTWTSAAGANERRPQNCLSWYDLHAFCIWDGGFLPSEAEWEYAAAGGSEERTYPWGATVPGTNTTLSVYGCYWNGTGSCSGVTNIAEVGSVAAGNGKWAQSDLAGNVYEWNLDWYNNPYVATCNNCANFTASSYRVVRGGSFDLYASYLPAASRGVSYPASRSDFLGGRCARTAP